MEIEPRFSIDKLTNTDLSFGPFKEWYFANNYIYDMGRNKDGRQSTWYMGLGTDIDTGLPMSLSMNVYAKYQWQNYGAANETSGTVTVSKLNTLCRLPICGAVS